MWHQSMDKFPLYMTQIDCRNHYIYRKGFLLQFNFRIYFNMCYSYQLNTITYY